jgi:phage shock protein C
MQVNRRLYRCQHDRKIAGVAAGLAEYFDVDPTIVRVLWVFSIFFGGLGLLLYIAMAIIVPVEPAPASAADAAAPGQPGVEGAAPAPDGWHAGQAGHRHTPRGTGRGMTIFGVILILFGALALVDAFLPDWAASGRFLWPAFVVGLGALLVVTAVRREPNGS